jgi:hypothetical protein
LVRAMSFGELLSWADRARLRAIVRSTHRMYFADVPTNAQCDQMIEAIGPGLAAAMLKVARDGRHVG